MRSYLVALLFTPGWAAPCDVYNAVSGTDLSGDPEDCLMLRIGENPKSMRMVGTWYNQRTRGKHRTSLVGVGDKVPGAAAGADS